MRSRGRFLRVAARSPAAVRLRILSRLAPWRRRLRAPRPELIVDAEPWLAALLASAARVRRPTPRASTSTMAVVVGPRARQPHDAGLPVVGYRTGTAIDLDRAPFVALDAMWRRPARMLRGAPEDVRLLNEAAARLVPRAPRDGSGTEAFVDACRDVHIAARRAYGRHAMDVVAEIEAKTSPKPPGGGPGVSVLCSTNRRANLEAVVDNYRQQRHESRELVVIAHGDGFDDQALADALGDVAGARWYRAPQAWTLGRCLNFGIEHCNERFVAKFDDDDAYGPEYLGDSLLAATASRATIVGKHSYFAVLERSDRTILRFPGRECRFTPYLAGGTLMIDVQAIGPLRFPDRNIGEDQGLIRACLAAGQAVFAGDMFNYVQRRGDHNTWTAADDYFARGALIVGDASMSGRAMV